MSAHARPMPNLGWDPAPGDVAGTQGLARRHADAITELNAIMALLKGIDLGPWQGDAKQATEVQVFEKAVPALQAIITDAGKMAEASRGWAGQLAGFQHDADALEAKAKAAKADVASAQQEKSGPGRLKEMDVKDAQDSADSVQTEAHELNEHYLEAAKKDAGEEGGEGEEKKSWFEQIEPYRLILEGVLSPLDIVAADHWIGLLEKAAGQPREWLGEVDEAIENVEGLQKAGKSASEALIEAANLAERVGGELDAFQAFAPGWLQVAARGVLGIKGLSYGLGGLGILADGLTILDPPDKGVLGWTERGAAGINGGLIAANMMMDEIPVVGEVVMIGTGVYLAGTFLYHHWKPFTNVCDAVGHGTVTAAKDIGHGAKKAWHAVTSLF
ncbi:hypothetical protein GCM10009839_05940 [Catenulispora yoronensis]|uniref:WXG100 family type VII secretion target n=1 Tax=Catenulispora yoronensis TaxID=450799 RepID=A0ABP5F1G7_9ACTN